jgi:hypothetical protein
VGKQCGAEPSLNSSGAVSLVCQSAEPEQNQRGLCGQAVRCRALFEFERSCQSCLSKCDAGDEEACLIASAGNCGGGAISGF